MKKFGQILTALLAAAALGCGGGDDHAHNHGPGGHSHGAGDDGHDHSHDDAYGGHSHEAKFGGALVELGEHQFHAEFVVDAEAGKLKAWVHDGHVENFVRVKAGSFTVKAKVGDKEEALTLLAMPNSATGETVGDTSYFEGQADWLKTVAEFEAEIVAFEVRGSKFENVAFSYPDGGDHDHGDEEAGKK